MLTICRRRGQGVLLCRKQHSRQLVSRRTEKNAPPEIRAAADQRRRTCPTPSKNRFDERRSERSATARGSGEMNAKTHQTQSGHPSLASPTPGVDPLLPRAQGLYDPAQRARFLRRRRRRRHEGPRLARHSREGPADPGQPRPSRRDRRRRDARRRLRRADPDPAPLLRRGMRQARLRPARARALRHRPVLHAARRRGARPRRGDRRRGDRRRRSAT